MIKYKKIKFKISTNGGTLKMNKIIKDEKALLNVLKKDIKNTNKNVIVFLAGHCPMLYTKEQAQLGVDAWGVFTLYSLELACQLAKYAMLTFHKTIKFVFFIDDHTYDNSGETLETSRTRNRPKRGQFYKQASGEKAILHEELLAILLKYGFSEENIIRQNQVKAGRTSCLYFSEHILRTSEKKHISNWCAREYIEFLEDKRYFDKEKYYQIAFIPDVCEDNICPSLGRHIHNLTASHIFMSTLNRLSKEQLFTFENVTYTNGQR